MIRFSSKTSYLYPKIVKMVKSRANDDSEQPT